MVSESRRGNILSDGYFVDTTELKILTEDGRSAAFTSKELEIVMEIAARLPPVITRAELIKAVWITNTALDDHLRRLRRRLASLDLEIKFEMPGSYRMFRRASPPTVAGAY